MKRKSWTKAWKQPIKVKERSPDFYWMVGILEGEGSFYPSPPSQRPANVCIDFKMTDKDIMARVAELLGVNLRGPAKRPPWSPTYRIVIKGSKAVAIMQLILPYMGVRRSLQINKVLDSYIAATGFNIRT